MLRILRLYGCYGNTFPAWRSRLAAQRYCPGRFHAGRGVFRYGIGMALGSPGRDHNNAERNWLLPGDVYPGWGAPSSNGLYHADPSYYSRDPLLDFLGASPETIVADLKTRLPG